MYALETLANWAQIVALPLAVIAIVVSIWAIVVQRRKKELSKVVRLFPLFQTASEYASRIELLLDGVPVRHVSVAQIEFHNTGDVPLVSSDFVAPMTLTFGEQAEILEAEVVVRSPGHRSISVQIDAGTVIVQPELINPADVFALKVVGSQIDKVDVAAQIVGVNEVGDIQFGASLARDYLPTALVLLTFSSLALILQSDFLW